MAEVKSWRKNVKANAVNTQQLLVFILNKDKKTLQNLA